MKIHSGMDLSELVSLMGRRVTLGSAPRMATLQEASDLRHLLVRDFRGKDTDDIDCVRWNLYCCAVDPDEQT